MYKAGLEGLSGAQSQPLLQGSHDCLHLSRNSSIGSRTARVFAHGAHLGLLALCCKGAVIVLCALIHKHLGHGDGAAREVGVVLQALPHLQNPTPVNA